jgi:hypothetical protein
VALALIALTAFTTFVVDYGVFWVSRRQAQNAADAGALAGAVALAYDDPNDRSSTGVAAQSAVAAAQRNPVWGAVPSVQPATDVFITGAGGSQEYPCPPPEPGDGDVCIRVEVFRSAARANALPTFFGSLVGLNQQDVRAMAAAKVTGGNATECLKPIALPDLYTTVSGNVVPTGNGYNVEDHYGTLVHIRDTGVGQPSGGGGGGGRGGRGGGGQGGGTNQLSAGWFQLLDFSGYGASPGSGAAAWRAAMTTCISGMRGIGETLVKENGVLGANVSNSTNMLYDLDPGASWDGQKIVNSCAETRSCDRWVQTGPNQFARQPDPGRTTSPRVLPIAVFDPVAFFANPGNPVVVTKLIGFFLDRPMAGPPNFDLWGILVSDIGLMSQGFGGADPEAAFLKVVTLVR